jgi:hypothetical protein
VLGLEDGLELLELARDAGHDFLDPLGIPLPRTAGQMGQAPAGPVWLEELDQLV